MVTGENNLGRAWPNRPEAPEASTNPRTPANWSIIDAAPEAVKMPRNAILVTTLLLGFAILQGAPSLHGQAVSIASVTGRVTDEQGALIGAARIQITGVDTGTVYNAVSNADGIYTIPNLPIGAYTLQAVVPGFQTYVQTGLVLRVG